MATTAQTEFANLIGDRVAVALAKKPPNTTGQPSPAGVGNLFGGWDRPMESLGRSIGDSIRTTIAKTSPANIFGMAAQSQTSGASVFGKSLELLAETVGTVLTPVFVVLAAGMVALGDYIWQKMLPNLGDWVKAVFKGADAVVDFVQQIHNSIGDMKEFFNTSKAPNVGATFFGNPDWHVQLSGERQPVKGGGLGALLAGAGSVFGQQQGALETPEPKGDQAVAAGGAVKDRFRTALGEVLREFQMSFGSRASRGGSLTGIREEAQMASMQTPFQTKLLDRLGKILEELQQAFAKPMDFWPQWMRP